jgi:hypothetical protein
MVSLGLRGMSVVPVLIKTTHLFGVFTIPVVLPATGIAMGVMVQPSLLSHEGVEPSSKKARPWSFLPVTSRYVYGIVH